MPCNARTRSLAVMPTDTIWFREMVT